MDLLPRELELDVDGAAGSAVVDDGLLIELLALSIVPRTSTFLPTYFDRSSLAFALSLRPFGQELALAEDDPVVPAVVDGGVVAGGFVVLASAVEPEPLAATFVSTKSPDELAVVDVLGVVVPVVPAGADESPFCTHPVTVTL